MKLLIAVSFLLFILLSSCTIIKRAEDAPVNCCYFNCSTLELTLKCTAGDNQIGVVDIYKGDSLVTKKDYKGVVGSVLMPDLKETLVNQKIRMYVQVPNAPWGNYYKIDVAGLNWKQGDIVYATKTER